MKDDLDRREFLGRVVLGTLAGAALPVLSARARPAAAAGATPAMLPQRILGRTGVAVPILAFGGGSRFLRYADEDDALAALHRAVDLGVTYLDTAANYGSGKSEKRVGRLLATRRRQVFVSTKIIDRGYDDFRRQLEGSLERLGVDQVDLLHIHGLQDHDDLARIEARDGALRALLEARDQRLTRFIGMTGHADGAALAAAIERHDLDCVQMPLNASRNGRFEELALPAARRKHLGVIAMKVTGQEFLLGDRRGRADFDSLLRYSLSLPVATAVIGMPAVDMIEHNARAAADFRPLTPPELDRLRRRLRPARKEMDRRLARHVDGPGDREGGLLA